MSNNSYSDPPSRDSGDQPVPERPSPPAAVEQDEVRNDSRQAANYEDSETKELAREFRIAEKWAIGINGVLAIIGILALVIYNGQLREMRKATRATEIAAKAAKDSADLARQTLQEMQKGGGDTHDLAAAAKVQADSTKQTAIASQKAADISAQSVRVAQQSFIDEQRAWIGIVGYKIAQFEEGKPIKVEIDIGNSGKTPAFQMEWWSKYNSSTIAELGPLPRDLASITEWQVGGAIPPSGQHAIYSEIPWENWKGSSLSFKLKNLVPSIYGEISYHDAGGRSHITQYCLYVADPETRNSINFCKNWNDMN